MKYQLRFIAQPEIERSYTTKAVFKNKREGQSGPIIVTEEVLKALQSGYRELMEGVRREQKNTLVSLGYL